MSLWADKHRPRHLSNLDYHEDLSTHLMNLANSEDFPHLLFYGPSGAGKKTRIAGLLKEIYGDNVEKIKIDERPFVTSSQKKIVYTVVSSNYHMELQPSELGNNDRVIVQEVIKDAAQNQQVFAGAKHSFKVVVIDQADSLTRDAQAALRRTMEKYTANMRLILCCNNLNKIISPVRSRCLLIRVARPSLDDTARVLQMVAKKENVLLPTSLAKSIGNQVHCDLRAALLSFESTAVRHDDLTQIQRAEKLDWEMVIAGIAKDILEDQSPAKLLVIRKKLYELLTHCIPSSLILKTLSLELFDEIQEDQIRRQIMDQAAIHEYRLRMGRKEIFHLESFTVTIMSIYKRYRNNL
ncbi:DNA clamp loader [Halteromyces radiatus]|uniref:DNA clamp loader n=1 Tax=Halteromyces radiatus TaxID=101107 RepID=UPI00221F3D4D|nr:DNA clamp loader [Halteromyces radiatus]KAI8085208.1 DNA clamp loader [Halteromyces radiatus]